MRNALALELGRHLAEETIAWIVKRRVSVNRGGGEFVLTREQLASALSCAANAGFVLSAHPFLPVSSFKIKEL